jgi:hypothetical protein
VGGRGELLADLLRWLVAARPAPRSPGVSGSGVTLPACSAVVSYRLAPMAASPPPTCCDAVGAAPRRGLTGRAADTGSMLRRLDERLAAGDASVEAALDRLAELSVAGSEAFRLGRVGALLAAVDAYCEAMAALGRAADLPIMSAEHDALWRLARRHGAAYKPSGAGGGDLGLVCSSDQEAARAAAAAATASGFRVVPLRLDPSGLTATIADAPVSVSSGLPHRKGNAQARIRRRPRLGHETGTARSGHGHRRRRCQGCNHAGAERTPLRPLFSEGAGCAALKVAATVTATRADIRSSRYDDPGRAAARGAFRPMREWARPDVQPALSSEPRRMHTL